MADGEITGVYLVPEDKMSEDGMDPIHTKAHNQEIRILNLGPSVAEDLAQVDSEVGAWGRECAHDFGTRGGVCEVCGEEV